VYYNLWEIVLKQFNIFNMQKIAIIMRGISGSGKSTVAKMISEAFNGSVHSTDSYFIGESGVYSFDPKKLGENHTLNQQAFKNSLSTGVPVVICDNTNVKNWEMEAYVKVAKDAGYWIVYMTMPHPDPKVAVKRNSHGVPEFAINKMIENWEPIEQSAIVDKTPSIIYTGLFVENNEELLKIFVPKHENVFGHHSTIAFKPNSLDGIEV
jgi:predicted kinase